MLTGFQRLEPRDQKPLAETPFDSWVTEDGKLAAEFYRRKDGFLVRFVDQADFTIDTDNWAITGAPVPSLEEGMLDDIFSNSLRPAIGNYLGELNLHGSAVATPTGALAFMGLSWRGKTTIAGAFARAGHPFLSEDRLALEWDGEAYQVQPQRAVLRVYLDSAYYLLGYDPKWEDEEAKVALDASDAYPFAAESAPLRAIFILGPGEASNTTIDPFPQSAALAELIRHAFVLDVEDKKRLSAHFARIGELAARVPVYALDYPRDYDHLDSVTGSILEFLDEGENGIA